MLTGSKSSIKSKRMLLGVISLGLLCAVMAVGFAHQISQHITGSADILVRSEREARKPERADARYADRMSALPAVPQTSAKFDLSRNVIAGGGGTSTGG